MYEWLGHVFQINDSQQPKFRIFNDKRSFSYGLDRCVCVCVCVCVLLCVCTNANLQPKSSTGSILLNWGTLIFLTKYSTVHVGF